MKTITIRLPAVEAAMLVEVQKRNNAYRDLQAWFSKHICEAYSSFSRPKS
jgi:hypothetical protein